MAESNNTEFINLKEIIGTLWKQRKRFYIVWAITFVLSCVLILCVPRYYTTEARLAPEVGGSISGGTLSDLASSFGFDLGTMQTTDAISPLLYPDLMDDNGFVASLFNIHVKTMDGEIDTDLYTYQKKYQESPWWSYIIDSIKKLFKKKEQSGTKDDIPFNPYLLSEDMSDVAEAIRGNIVLSLDKKTGVISVSVKSQDQLVCKTVADSVVARLQDFIINYRTNKARIDEKHYEQLASEAFNAYEAARLAYSTFTDLHTNATLSAYRTQEESLLNDMQLKYSTYTTITAQLLQARAKVQERTPAFTMLKGAEVPVKPAGPKRMLFVIGMLFLATFATMAYLLKGLLWKF